MPTIICSYCQYVGQDTSEDKYLNIDAIWEDVLKHEKICPEKRE